MHRKLNPWGARFSDRVHGYKVAILIFLIVFFANYSAGTLIIGMVDCLRKSLVSAVRPRKKSEMQGYHENSPTSIILGYPSRNTVIRLTQSNWERCFGLVASSQPRWTKSLNIIILRNEFFVIFCRHYPQQFRIRFDNAPSDQSVALIRFGLVLL